MNIGIQRIQPLATLNRCQWTGTEVLFASVTSSRLGPVRLCQGSQLHQLSSNMNSRTSLCLAQNLISGLTNDWPQLGTTHLLGFSGSMGAMSSLCTQKVVVHIFKGFDKILEDLFASQHMHSWVLLGLLRQYVMACNCLQLYPFFHKHTFFPHSIEFRN